MIVQIPCLVGTYIYYLITFYIHRAILTQTNDKEPLKEKKIWGLKKIQVFFSF